MQKKRSSSKTVIIVMLITLFARFFGLLREILIARYYGTSVYTDAYIIANNIPTVLFDTLGQALLTSFIPMYSTICQDKNANRANVFTLHLIVYLLIICTAITFAGELFAKQIVAIFASGFRGEALEITIQFTRILFPSLFAMTLLNLFTGYLQIYQKFELATSVTVIGNLAIIVALVISNILDNVYFFVWGSLVGLFLQVFFLVPSVIKQGLFRNKIRPFQHDEYVKQIIPLLIPVFIGSALNEINSIIDRTMVSGIGTGAVSTLNYAYKIISLAISVIATPLITIMYPNFSKLAAECNDAQFKDSVHKCINYVLAIIIPVSSIILIYRDFLIKILFERGNFDAIASLDTSRALACYTIGLTPIAIQQVLIRVFYSKHDTVTPMINGAICAIVNIGLDYILINRLGCNGAAIATSIVSLVACIILIVFLCKRRILSITKIGSIFIKNMIAGIAMFALLWWLSKLLIKKTIISSMNILIISMLIIIASIMYIFMQTIVCKNKNITNKLCEILHHKCTN